MRLGRNPASLTFGEVAPTGSARAGVTASARRVPMFRRISHRFGTCAAALFGRACLHTQCSRISRRTSWRRCHAMEAITKIAQTSQLIVRHAGQQRSRSERSIIVPPITPLHWDRAPAPAEFFGDIEPQSVAVAALCKGQVKRFQPHFILLIGQAFSSQSTIRATGMARCISSQSRATVNIRRGAMNRSKIG